MRRPFTICFLALMVLGSAAVAQQLHCGTSEKMAEQLALNPELAAARNNIQEFTERWIAENGNKTDRAVVTIPVVVHVVYSTTAQNISDEQIQSQIDVLNEDYRAMNADVVDVPSVWTNLVADCEIQFGLAQQDPDGFLSNGITRTQTTVTNWNGSDDVKYTNLGGRNGWPPNDYLNIWVCNIGGGLLGFAYQPGITPTSLDGIVIGFRYFGNIGNLSSSYGLGRTTTHEIGHYFNLDHLWGSGGTNTNCNASDLVSDTPVQLEPNYSDGNGNCTEFPHISCNNGPNGDMANNYMDYGDDECLNFFTNGQRTRMLAALNGPRAGLKTSDGLTPGIIGINESVLSRSLSVFPNPTNDQLYISLESVTNALTDIRLIDPSGRVILLQSNVWLGTATHRLYLSELSAGIYVLQLNSEHESVNRKIHIQ